MPRPATRRASALAASRQDAGRVETDEASEALNAAYEAKQGRRYPTIVPSILAPQARVATLKLVPRTTTTGT